MNAVEKLLHTLGVWAIAGWLSFNGIFILPLGDPSTPVWFAIDSVLNLLILYLALYLFVKPFYYVGSKFNV